MTDTKQAEIEIFWGSGSPFAWRVLMTAELKGIPYRSHQLQFSEKEHKAADYLALNRRGEVPTLRHGDYVLTESLAIMAYLDAAFPEPPLFGRTAEETGAVWSAISAVMYHVEPASNRIVGAVFDGAVDARQDEIRAAAAKLHDELARLDQPLSGRSWLAGNQLTGADILAHSALGFFLRIAARDDLAPLDLGFDDLTARYPSLCAWRERMTTIPGYDKAYPPHWRTS
jgi:glutathione S-transferase